MSQRRWTDSGTLFYVVSVTLSLVVGALQMQRVHGGWVTDYGADIAGTAWLYALARQGRTVLRRGPLSTWQASMIVLVGCVASEFVQWTEWLGGTFDPRDLLAYAATVAACAALDLTVGLDRRPADRVDGDAALRP